MDRTKDWWLAVDASCRALEVPEATITKWKSQAVMRSSFKHPPFMLAALAVLQSIHELRDFIKLHQEGYLGKDTYSNADKDHIELEVGALVKECAQRVDQLKDSVLAAQKQSEQQHASSAGVVNAQTAAHRHGVVLSLAEHLHAVSARFDRARAQRYQQLTDSKPLPVAAQLAQQQHALPVSGSSSTKLSKSGGLLGHASNSSQAVVKAAQLGGVVFSHVKGMAQSALGGMPQHSSSAQALLQEEEAAKTSVQRHPAGPAQKQLEMENHDIVAQLTKTSQAVHDVERSVREIATLNQLFSAAVLHQAEAIEAIYANAVEASLNLKRGTKEIQKTIEANKSSRRYILAILLSAIFALLFFDWFNS